MTDLSFADHFGAGRDDNPYWNESVWFSMSIPERRMHGLIQYYFRPNMGMLNGGPVLWDPSGTFQWNCLYYNWSHLQALPAGARKFDMRARNSLSCRVIEPLRRYKLDYARDGFELDLEWTAIGPMHELKTGDAGQKATAKFHIEQPGRMKGTIRRHGEAFAVDCFSMRDTSYGARDYESLARGGYFWGIAANSSFHALCMGAGREAASIGGYIMRDGTMASLVSGKREIIEYGRFGPSSVVFEAADALGRTMRATGSIDPGLVFTGYTDHTVVWSLVEWDWDGVTHWGDNQEFCPDETFRRIARGEIALGAA
ncbi:hypothetical protein [Novosphingobium album (ex Liu et al. 2023)]|uniref:Uncharacterized protein n=1 Tax=Novosphingobium album (ex Liu et al. 2023) TaxID=3031130 RepID=A0ABT5WV29_9SPHN|nr:hypothetical protein [Novosphingobium album (ex Liu et al. 2023)]MDE8653742.1 hypothetical protein [Novosphingobium album (ex Liu et al. 2023)]